MSLPAYPIYKESGAQWIGKIPIHWQSVALKRNFKLVGGSTPKSDHPAYWDGDIVWVTPSDLSKLNGFEIDAARRNITSEGLKSCATTIVPEGSVILSTRAPIGSLAIASKQLCTNQGCKSLVPTEGQESRFLAYTLSSATSELNTRGKGTTFLELSGEELGALKVPCPGKHEQQAIVTFLDHETAKIDALISGQERLVGLLREKRQAVVKHAVTKGLDSTAPMKRSGLEWSDETPSHWTVCLLKRAFQSIDYGISDALEVDGEVAILRMGNIQNGKVILNDLKFVDHVDSELLLKKGDLLYNRTNSIDLVGKVGMFNGGEIDGKTISFASYLVRLRVVSDCVPEFFSYLLNTDGILGLVRSSAFVAIGQCNLNPTRYGEIMVAVPPRSEQVAVVKYLDVETSSIDKLAEESLQAIALLRERRSAIISAAVTGKIDVRGLA